MTKKKIFIFGGIAVGIVALIGFNAAAQGDAATTVRIEEVGRENLVATVTASGQIQPKTSVDISADITGRVIEIPVQEGDIVRAGQLLLRIDPSLFDAQVARAEASVSSAQASALQARASRDQAQRAYDRFASLRRQDPNLVSDEELETSRTNFEVAEAIATSANHQVEQARASLTDAEEQLAKTVLRAPMAGEITRMAVEVGEVAVPGNFSPAAALLMTVSDLSVIQVNVRVDETDVVRLHMWDSTEVTIDAFPDTTFSGRVTKIGKSSVQGASAAGTTNQAVDYDVEVTIDDPPVEVRPDLSATAKIVTATRDSVLSVPIIALTVREHTPISTETQPADTTAEGEETEGVFVIIDGMAQFRPVRTGIAGEEHFEVLEGVAEGDSIVAGPYQTIRDLEEGSAVRASNATEEGNSQ